MRQITEIIKRSLFLFINVNNQNNTFIYICTIEVLLKSLYYYVLSNAKSIHMNVVTFKLKQFNNKNQCQRYFVKK